MTRTGPIPTLAVAWLAAQALAAQTATDSDQGLTVTTFERQRQRVTYFGENPATPSPGQVTCEFGRLQWTDGADQDGRWNAGLGFWSTLDVNCPMEMGGKAIRPGHYYLSVDRKGGHWTLLLSNAAAVTKQKLPFSAATELSRAIAIPLQQTELEGVPRHLSIFFRTVDRVNAPEKLTFSLQWGPHAYEAPVQLKNLGKVAVFPQAEARSRTVLTLPAADPSEQPVVTVEHAVPEWDATREAQLEALPPGTRWRLGQNYWSSLETNVALTFAKKKVKPGYYFLMLGRVEEDEWSLILLPAAVAMKQSMDAFQAPDSRGGITIPLTTAAPGDVDKPTAKLAIRFVADAETNATLSIAWGPHHLSTPVEVAPR